MSMQYVAYNLTQEQIMKMEVEPVPVAVQVRNLLNLHGFKFKDDGKLCSIVNETPEPVSELHIWRDEDTLITHFKQIFDKENQS